MDRLMQLLINITLGLLLIVTTIMTASTAFSIDETVNLEDIPI